MADELILIVEDEKITGMDIGQTVREFGYESVGPVASGQDAVTSAMATIAGCMCVLLGLTIIGRKLGSRQEV